MKVVTVTLNPAVDRTVFLKKLKPGGLNRVRQVVEDAGGKGINVSGTLRALGADCLATGLLARQGGGVIYESLDKAGIAHDFVEIDAAIRTNTKLAEENGSVTELNEAGPAVRPEAVMALEEKLRAYAAQGVLFVFAGSAPPGIGNDIYERLIRVVHKKGAKALLDADGELFADGIKAIPDIVKPNKAELKEYFTDLWQKEGKNGKEEPDILRILGKRLLDKGIDTVMISCGAEGAVFLRRDGASYRIIRHPALSVKVCSTVGAGDAMTAGYCYAWLKGMDFAETAGLCMAVSAASVTTEGTKPPAAALVKELGKKITR